MDADHSTEYHPAREPMELQYAGRTARHAFFSSPARAFELRVPTEWWQEIGHPEVLAVTITAKE